MIDNEGLGRKSSKRAFFTGFNPAIHFKQLPYSENIRLADQFYSSLVCCIYHKAREVGESSTEEDSDSSSSSDSDEASDGDVADDGRARMGGKGKRKDNGHQHGDGEEGCGDRHGGEGGSWKGKERPRRTARNAYERAPKNGGVVDVKK